MVEITELLKQTYNTDCNARAQILNKAKNTNGTKKSYKSA